MRDDQQIRIEKLKSQIEEAAGERPTFGITPYCPPEIEEEFLRRVLAYELAKKEQRARPRSRKSK